MGGGGSARAPGAARSLQCRLQVSRPLAPSDNGRWTQVEPIITSGDALPQSPPLAGTAGENQGHRGGATGEWPGSHTPAAERGPTEWSGSWPARPANSLRSVVPACRGSSEDWRRRRRRRRQGRKTGQGRGGSCACARGGSASEPPARPAHTGGGQPRPGSQGSSGRRSAVGGGEVEKGDCGRLRSSAFRWKDREDGLWRLHLQPPPLPPPPLLPPPPGDAPSIRLQPGDSQPGRGLGPGPPASSESSPELPPAPPTLCPPLRLRPPPHPRAASQPRGRFLSRAPRSP